MVPSYNKKASFKLAQLREALGNKSPIEIIEKLLEEGGDINYAILPADSSFKFSTPHLIGFTALHFACRRRNKDAIKYLLNHGADFTKKNEAGETVIHVLMDHLDDEKIPADNLLIDTILSAHVTTNNYHNPCNGDGLSHFHIACMKNHTEAVQFFLDNGIPVDEPVSAKSKISPGYTPLHFAAMHSNPKVAEILLAFGADMYITDASGKTPLHTLIERRMAMFDSLGIALAKKDESYEKLQGQIQDNEKIINMLLENMSSDNDCLDSIGLSNFHVACMLLNTSVAQDLADRVTDLNQCINEDSTLWPGYTAMHFAAHFSISTVEMLIKKGANIELKDAKGLTPLDICIQRYKVEDIYNIMSHIKKWKNVLFSNRKTNLLSFLLALADRDDFKQMMRFLNDNINMRIPMSSSIWPGYTPLHLAVLFAERSKKVFHEQRVTKQNMDLQIIRFCLNEGADLSIQDRRGQTPLHLAFRHEKDKVVDIILHHSPHIPNISDDENLTHLHIVCAAYKQKNKLKKCAMLNNSEVNAVYKGTSKINVVRPGWTPLHVALNFAYDKRDLENKVTALMKHGANPCVKDAYGLTPIHWLLGHCSLYPFRNITTQVLKESTNDCIAEEYGISHFHIACEVDAREHMEHFLNNGSDVNLAIKNTPENDEDPMTFLSEYANYTPLHSFLTDNELKDLEFLLDRGADVFAKKADGTIPLMDSDVHKIYFSRLKNNVALQEQLERQFGWTKLHVACQVYELAELDKFQDLVKATTDVNAKIFSSSPIWGGYTPLHVLMFRLRHMKNYNGGLHVMVMTRKIAASDREIISSMSKILLENGADVNIVDDQGNSPIGALLYAFSHDKEAAIGTAALLMKYQRDFNVNPVNDQGVSHFHIACYSNIVDAVKQFLLHGIDVNHPIDFFADWCPGYTPLHLATNSELINLLINHGADANIEDVKGYIPLHKVVKHDNFDENIIMKMIESGAEINHTSLSGETPFETAISDGKLPMEKLTFFIRQGFLVNSCNPITRVSFISIILDKYYSDKNLKKLILETVMNEKSSFILGRTTIHHLVTRSAFSTDDYSFLEKLIKSGHEIDQRDNDGKTALHLAVEFTYTEGVHKLLEYGADINVLDKNGHTALSYAFTKPADSVYPEKSKSIKEMLITRAFLLHSMKLDLELINRLILGVRKISFSYDSPRNFIQQVVTSKQFEIGVRSLHLRDFLSETGAIMIYASLSELERCKIDQCLEAFSNDANLRELKGILRLQHRKAVERLELFASARISAINSLRLLLGFNLPDLCADHLLQYLPNSDFKNIIRAGIEYEDMKMDVD